MATLASCSTNTDLPVLANPHTGQDSAQIPAFSFIDQEGATITEKQLEGKIVVADFIFLNCRTICPVMNQHLLDVYKTFENNPTVVFLSHTVDPVRDSIGALKAYANQLGVKAEKWHFLTGNKDSIYNLAHDFYFNDVEVDTAQPGNYLHAAALVLLDQNRHIRGVYDGTDPKETERLVLDITKLIK